MQEEHEPSVPDTFDLQGHRGARGLYPENTIPAFQRALELGVTTLEMDVVISKDEKVVVSHDPWMSSQICSLPSGEPVSKQGEREHRLWRMTYEEISCYDSGQRPHPRFPRQQPRAAPKPLLREVISMAEAYCRETDRPPVYYNIETKSRPSWEGQFHPGPETFTRLLYDVLAETQVVQRATLQSFDRRTLRVGRDIDSAWALSLLTYWPAFIGRQVRRLGFTPDVFSPDHRLLTARQVRRAHERGMRIIPWTVNAPRRMRRLHRMGVDGLITDYPDIGRQVLDAIEAGEAASGRGD